MYYPLHMNLYQQDPLTNYTLFSTDLECKTNSFGDTFAGLTNTSKSGWPCEPWVDVIRSFGVYQTEEEIYAQYPIVREAGSACRNPDFDSDGPWCYVRRGEFWIATWGYFTSSSMNAAVLRRLESMIYLSFVIFPCNLPEGEIRFQSCGIPKF